MKKEYVTGVRRFTNQDFFFEHEVLFEDIEVNLYVAMGCWDEIFGLHMQDDESINVYTNYNLETGTVQEDLLLVLKCKKKDHILHYRMNEAERQHMTNGAEEYLKKQGVLRPGTPSIIIEFGPRAGELHIGSENSSGCEYQEVLTVEDLREKISNYIDQYVK